MKKTLYVCICILCLITVGCSRKNNYEDRIIDLTVEKLIEKIESKDNFIVMFTQPSCGQCVTFKKMLVEYLKDNNVIINDVSLDKSTNDSTEMASLLKKIRKHFPDMHSTPDVYYIEKGEIHDYLNVNAIDTNIEENFNNWIDKNHLNSDKNYIE